MGNVRTFASSYSATEVNKSGAKVYDEAWAAGAVEVTRRGQRFVLLRQDYLQQLLDAAKEDKPQTLEDLLKDYDADKIRHLTGAFEAAPATGKELI